MQFYKRIFVKSWKPKINSISNSLKFYFSGFRIKNQPKHLANGLNAYQVMKKAERTL